MADEGVTIRFLLQDDTTQASSDRPAPAETTKPGDGPSALSGDALRRTDDTTSVLPTSPVETEPPREPSAPAEPPVSIDRPYDHHGEAAKLTPTKVENAPEAPRSVPIEPTTQRPREPEIAPETPRQATIPAIPVEPNRPEPLPPIKVEELDEIRKEYGPVAAEAVAATREVIEPVKPVEIEPTAERPDVLPMTGRRRARRQDPVRPQGEIQSVRIVSPIPLPVTITGDRPVKLDEKPVTIGEPTHVDDPEVRGDDRPGSPMEGNTNDLVQWFNDEFTSALTEGFQEAFDQTKYVTEWAPKVLEVLERIAACSCDSSKGGGGGSFGQGLAGGVAGSAAFAAMRAAAAQMAAAAAAFAGGPLAAPGVIAGGAYTMAKSPQIFEWIEGKMGVEGPATRSARDVEARKKMFNRE